MVNKEIEKEIINLYESKLSSNQISKKLKRSSSGIRLILRRNNINLRTKSEANLICKDVKRGKEHFNWNGGKSFHKGQVYINLNHKRVKESHYNWCIANQFPIIPKGMIIHHADCNKFNNAPENLIMIDQSTHVKLHVAIEDEKFRRYFKMREINKIGGGYNRHL